MTYRPGTGEGFEERHCTVVLVEAKADRLRFLILAQKVPAGTHSRNQLYSSDSKGPGQNSPLEDSFSVRPVVSLPSSTGGIGG